MATHKKNEATASLTSPSQTTHTRTPSRTRPLITTQSQSSAYSTFIPKVSQSESILNWLWENRPPLVAPALLILFSTFKVIPPLYFHHTTEYKDHYYVPPFNSNQDQQQSDLRSKGVIYDVHPHTTDTYKERSCINPPHDEFQTYICTNDAWATIGMSPIHNSPFTPLTSSSSSSNTQSTTTTTTKTTLTQEERFRNALQYLSKLKIGAPQRIDGSTSEQIAVQKVILQMEDYFKNEILAHPLLYSQVVEYGLCQNTNELCAFWTSVGECESNRGFMLTNCAASCRLCALLYMNLNTLLH